MYFYIFLSFHFAPFLRRWTRRFDPRAFRARHQVPPLFGASDQRVTMDDVVRSPNSSQTRPVWDWHRTTDQARGSARGGQSGGMAVPCVVPGVAFFGLSIHATRPKTVLEARDESLL